MEELISIIVPVYNVEQYLPKCVDSILSQTHQNLDIILVDDGSLDRSGEICEEYAKKDSRIRVIHKENGGLSSARNAGIEKAAGQYIGFVDSDDWIAPDMYEYLLNGIRTSGADIAICEYYSVYPQQSFCDHSSRTTIYVGRSASEALLSLKIPNYSVNKLYSRELFDSIRFPEGTLYEDVRIMYRIFEKCHSVIALNEPKYYYRKNEVSIVNDPSIGNKIACVEARMSRYRIVEKQWPDLRNFLLNEIFARYCMELRDTICSRSKEEFAAQEKNLSVITDFLRDYKKDILYYLKPGPIARMELDRMCSGTRGDWIYCGLIAKIIRIKKRLEKTTYGKQLKKRLQAFKRQKASSYYYKCLRMPLGEKMALFSSRGGQDFASNILYTAKEMEVRGFSLYIVVSDHYKEKVLNLVKLSGLKNYKTVLLHSRDYYKAFATAKYLFDDMVYEDTILKREGQIWVNLWHGTPLKCLDLDVIPRRFELGGSSRQFLKTDFFAVPSQFMLDKLVDSARVRNLLVSTYAVHSGYPRNQVFYDSDNRTQLRKKFGIDNKEVYVYMPTWREAGSSHDKKYSVNNIIDFFESTLHDNQIMYVKLHNYDSASVNYRGLTHVFPFPADVEPYQFLNTADCLITDYSSVFFDFANTGRKIILFTYDAENYLATRGTYLPMNDLPFTRVCSYEELRNQLNIIKEYDDTAFRAKYCTYDGPNAVKTLINHILGVHTCQAEKITGNGKRNVLYYDSRMSDRPYKPDKAIELLRDLSVDSECNNYYGYRKRATKFNPGYLENLPARYGPFVLSEYTVLSPLQKFLLSVFHYVTPSLARFEANREMYGLPFDEIHIIDDNPYDEHARLLKKYKNYAIK